MTWFCLWHNWTTIEGLLRGHKKPNLYLYISGKYTCLKLLILEPMESWLYDESLQWFIPRWAIYSGRESSRWLWKYQQKPIRSSAGAEAQTAAQTLADTCLITVVKLPITHEGTEEDPLITIKQFVLHELRGFCCPGSSQWLRAVKESFRQADASLGAANSDRVRRSARRAFCCAGSVQRWVSCWSFICMSSTKCHGGNTLRFKQNRFSTSSMAFS